MSPKKKTKPKSSSRARVKLPSDPATRYARDVVAGKVIAGPHVRASCQRHLDDLRHGKRRGLTWHPDLVKRVVDYFRLVLTVEVEYDEDGESHSRAVPFVLEPSQAFIVGSLFGWKRRGLRRFRRAYVEEAKGNGKSPLGAGIGHYMMTATGKLRAECYCAATDRDQAAIPFRDAVEMWRRSPALYKRLAPSGQNPVWQLTYLKNASFFKPISSEKKGKSGIRPYYALVDEIHEHPDNSVIEMLRAGTKGNREALVLEITNSGASRESVCWDEHDYAIRVASQEVENDAFFSYVCALDDDDDPFEDESCWVKANPLLGVSIHADFIRDQVREAQGLPSKESMVRRLHFCQWTDALDGWVTRRVWEHAEAPLRLEDYRGERCFGGLDLSYTADLSACAWAFPVGKDRFDCFVDFWKPKASLADAIKKDRVPYDLWAKNGHLILTEGKVIKLGPIAQRLAEIADGFDLQGLAFDRYRHRELADDLLDLGVELPMVEHPQGFRRGGEDTPLWMPNSVQALENGIIEGRIRVAINPVLRYNAMSVVVRVDPAGTDNRIFDKRKSLARIDGVVALAMAVGLATWQPKEDEPEYRMLFV